MTGLATQSVCSELSAYAGVSVEDAKQDRQTTSVKYTRYRRVSKCQKLPVANERLAIKCTQQCISDGLPTKRTYEDVTCCTKANKACQEQGVRLQNESKRQALAVLLF